MRKLVTVRTVDGISSIPNADAIETATVEGWSVVIKKGEFDVGDPCIFFEIDSFLPLSDKRFSFLEKNKITWEGKLGVRLRTMKLRGQLSQGLILPLKDFPEVINAINSADIPSIRNLDFSELLNIEKWEAPIPACLSGEVHGGFPSYIRKTDQERIQNLPDILKEDLNTRFEVTIKLDGSSMTVFHHEGNSGVCGRNWWLKETEDNTLWQVARRNALIEALEAIERNVALQGELVGEGIQSNPEKLKGQEFFLFDIFDIDTQSYLGHRERNSVVEALKAKGAVIKEVPRIGFEPLSSFGSNLEELLAFADGPSLNPKTRREGLVFKEIDGRFSFKVISNHYLLKHGDR